MPASPTSTTACWLGFLDWRQLSKLYSRYVCRTRITKNKTLFQVQYCVFFFTNSHNVLTTHAHTQYNRQLDVKTLRISYSNVLLNFRFVDVLILIQLRTNNDFNSYVFRYNIQTIPENECIKLIDTEPTWITILLIVCRAICAVPRYLENSWRCTVFGILLHANNNIMLIPRITLSVV